MIALLSSRGTRAALMATVLALGCGLGHAQTSTPSQALQLRSLAATCATCHGTDGKAVEGENMAALAGRSKEDIVTQMLALRDGKRPATVMHQLTKGYTDAQIDAIASYFASKK